MSDVQATDPGRGAASAQPLRIRMQKRLKGGHSFILLFLLLLVSLALLIGGTDARLGRFLGQILIGSTLLLAVLAADASRRWRILGLVAFGGAFLTAIFGELLDLSVVSAFVGLLFMVMLVASVPLVLGSISRHEKVTGETVAGALCVYLLLGMAFANLNLALSSVQHVAVLVSSADPSRILSRGDFYYYSFITMATVGFGDIVPVTNVTKTLTVFQAVLGQLFLVTIVARLVSMVVVKRREKPETASEEESPKPVPPGGEATRLHE